MEEWGLLEGGRLGAAATTIGFSSQATSTRPIGVVIPRFAGQKRPRGSGGVRGKEADRVEEEGEQALGSKGMSTTEDPSSLLNDELEALPIEQQQQHKGGQDRELVAPPLPGKQRIWYVWSILDEWDRCWHTRAR